MANMIQNAKDSINALLAAACERAAAKGQLPAGAALSGTVEIPKDTQNGDYAANHAMTGARALHMAPRKIAEALKDNLELAGSWFASVEVAGPGFINFRLAPSWYADVLKAVADEGQDYGRVDEGHGKRLMVEFVSANPTGPMHMGNARGGVLGDALASVMDRAGYRVWREFYVNDAGNQIEKFAASIDARYRQQILGEDAVEFPADGYQGEDIRELARAFYDAHGDSYLEKDVAERHAAMARFGLDRNIPKMQADLERYGVRYDEWFFESSLHESGYVAETVEKLAARGYTYEKDGALWLRTAQILTEGLLKAGKTQEEIAKLELKDDVLRRANGFYTYFAADIAYHRNKLEARGFDLAINVWGADHHGHVARLKGALDALGLDGENRLQIVLMQLVKLMSEGHEVRMSKRTGKATRTCWTTSRWTPPATSSTPGPSRRSSSIWSLPSGRTTKTRSTTSSTPTRASARSLKISPPRGTPCPRARTPPFLPTRRRKSSSSSSPPCRRRSASPPGTMTPAA